MSSTAKPHLNPHVQEVVDWLNEQNDDTIRLTNNGRTITVEVVIPDIEMVVSSLESIRPQICAELKRVADLFQYIADRVEDTDWCKCELVEIECEQRAAEAWRAAGFGHLVAAVDEAVA